MSEKISFVIPTLHTESDADTIEAEIFGLGGVIDVEIEIEEQHVMVEWDPPATWEAIQTVLQEIDYPAGQVVDGG